MARVTLSGPELAGLPVDQPAASVRLLIPGPGAEVLEVPTWRGNEFLNADGSRPIIRTFTPRYLRPQSNELDVDVVLHPGGSVAAWVESAEAGAPAAVSGTGRGHSIDGDGSSLVLAGDETAIPAIGQLIEAVAPAAPRGVIIEVTDPAARIRFGDRVDVPVSWVTRPDPDRPGSGLLPALRAAEIDGDARVWVAGEAGAMFEVRKHLLEDRKLDRSQTTVRGYWKRRSLS